MTIVIVIERDLAGRRVSQRLFCRSIRAGVDGRAAQLSMTQSEPHARRFDGIEDAVGYWRRSGVDPKGHVQFWQLPLRKRRVFMSFGGE